MKIIDAHCHIHKQEWVKNNDSMDFIIQHFNQQADEEAILENIKKAGIDRTIIFPLPSVNIDLEKANHYTLEVAKKYPEKLIPFTVIDNKPEYWLKKGVKGFKEHTFGQRIQKDAEGNDIFSQKFKETYKFMEKHELPLILHAGVNKVERLKEDILVDTPDLLIILAHLGADFLKTNNYLPEIERVSNILKELKEYPNIYYDVSTIVDKKILDRAIKIVGIENLIFCSDFPYEKPVKTLERFNSLSYLTEEAREKILFKNITKILKQGDVNNHG